MRHYLDFLDRTLLVRLVRLLELRLKEQRGAPKICLAYHGLRASWLQEIVPLDPPALSAVPDLASLAGHLAESVAGSYLLTIPGLDLAHFPARPDEPEVDFVVTIGTHRIPIEVKYKEVLDPGRDTLGLRSFLDRTVYQAPFGILVTRVDGPPAPDRRIVTLPLSSLLILR